MKKTLLAGNGITAKILSAHLRLDDRYDVCGAVVDDEFAGHLAPGGFPAVGLSEVVEAYSPDIYEVIMAMGYHDLNRSRERMFNRLKGLGYRIETYVHPRAEICTEFPLGEGSVVLPGAILDPYVKLGVNTMVWSNATLAHHSSVGDHCWVATGCVVSGQASISNNTFLGVNSTVVNEVMVGEFNIVGASSLITKDTKPNSVYLMRSAELLRYSSQDYVKHIGL